MENEKTVIETIPKNQKYMLREQRKHFSLFKEFLENLSCGENDPMTEIKHFVEGREFHEHRKCSEFLEQVKKDFQENHQFELVWAGKEPGLFGQRNAHFRNWTDQEYEGIFITYKPFLFDATRGCLRRRDRRTYPIDEEVCVYCSSFKEE